MLICFKVQFQKCQDKPFNFCIYVFEFGFHLGISVSFNLAAHHFKPVTVKTSSFQTRIMLVRLKESGGKVESKLVLLWTSSSSPTIFIIFTLSHKYKISPKPVTTEYKTYCKLLIIRLQIYLRKSINSTFPSELFLHFY